MTFIMYVLLFSFVFGLAAVASNPSPYYGALGLAMVSGFGCGVLLHFGSSFLSLVLLLIYLGGMLVVFGYSSAFSADPYPKGWGSGAVLVYLVGYVGTIIISAWVVGEEWGWHASSWVPADEQNAQESMFRGENAGVGLLYAAGVGMLLICGLALLITLLVVLEIVRRVVQGAGRPV